MKEGAQKQMHVCGALLVMEIACQPVAKGGPGESVKLEKRLSMWKKITSDPCQYTKINFELILRT